MKARSKSIFLISLVALVTVFVILLGSSERHNFRNQVIAMDAREKGIQISEEIEEILYYATLAPSSHNAQMWKVRIVSPEIIEVLLDRKHTLSEVDPLNREAMISLGAFIENLSQAARLHGLNAKITIVAESSFDERIVHIRLERSGMITSEDAAELRRNLSLRGTSRRGFKNKPLKEEHLSSLLMTVPGKVHYYPLGSPKGQYLLEGLIESNEKQANRDNVQEELSQWIRFSKREAEKTEDGLTPQMMGIKGIAGWFVSHFFNSDTVMKDSFRKQTVTTLRKQVENCSGFIVLTDSGKDAASLIRSGMELERLWLKASQLGLVIHPMSQMIEEDPWKSELVGKLELDTLPQMMLRTGYSDTPFEPVSRRRPVSSIIETDIQTISTMNKRTQRQQRKT